MSDVTPAGRLTPSQQDRRSDLLVIALVLVALVVGWFVKTGFQYRTNPVSQKLPNSSDTLSLAVPVNWAEPTLPVSNTGSLLTYQDPAAGSPYKTSVTFAVRNTDPQSPITLPAIVDREIAAHTKNDVDFPGYQLLADVKDTTVDGQPAKLIQYAYAAKPIDIQVRNAPPVVVHALEYVVLKGNRLYLITETVDERLYADERDELQRIVDTVKLP